MERLDFKKTHPELYRATRKIREVVAEEVTFLAVEGQGDPGGKSFQQAFAELIAVAHTVQLAVQLAGELDFVVPPPGCLWFDDPAKTPKSQWHWKLLLQIPEPLTAAHVRDARKTVLERQGFDPASVKRIAWKEGRCLQVLHVGPYEGVGPEYQRLFRQAEAMGCAAGTPCHEIYLSDPRRVAAEKLKTIVRIPLTRALAERPSE